MTDKQRVSRAYQEYLQAEKILGDGAATGPYRKVVVMALIRIVNLLERGAARKG